MSTQMLEKSIATAATTTTTSDYPQLQAMLRSDGGGAWMREASLTLALAAQANIRLDEQTMIYSDVRDLLALQAQLRQLAR